MRKSPGGRLPVQPHPGGPAGRDPGGGIGGAAPEAAHCQRGPGDPVRQPDGQRRGGLRPGGLAVHPAGGRAAEGLSGGDGDQPRPSG